MVDMEFYWGVNASTIYNLHSYANCPLLACSRIHIFGQLQDGVNSWQNLVWRSGLKLLLMERTNKCFSTTATQLSFHKLCMQAGVWHIWLVVLSYRNNKPQNTPKSTPKGIQCASLSSPTCDMPNGATRTGPRLWGLYDIWYTWRKNLWHWKHHEFDLLGYAGLRAIVLTAAKFFNVQFAQGFTTSRIEINCTVM